ncbi:MAG TPA: prepilin peptidase, partial [Bryobacteraceae bacterium]|nr:prepilin peptidase [Bryobacteraceae bacterium]
MLTFDLLPFGVEIILIPLIVTAAVYDIRFRRIPNWLNIVGVLTGLAMNSFLYRGWAGLRMSLIGLVVALSGCFVLYSMHAMGAGDLKLMAAIGAMVGFQNWLGILLVRNSKSLGLP